jgi:uncharacterized protein YwgA
MLPRDGERSLTVNAYDFVHLSLYAMGDEIKGKTKLQKAIYFLGVLSEMLPDLGYRPHYYGPYSAEVAGAVDRLRALGFLDQRTASAGAVDQSGFEVARYDIALTESGNRMAKAKAARDPQAWNMIQNAVRSFKKAEDLDYMKLSIAAKTYFMLGEKREQATIDELASLARRFGWTVTPAQITEAARFLERLSLVKLGPDDSPL